MKQHLTLLFLLCLFLVAGCKKNQTAIKFLLNDFEDEVSLHENLTFTLNQDVIPDSLFFKWDTTEYIQFTPPVKGRFKWKSANELVFSAREKLPPSTDFTGQLTPAILQFKDSKKYKIADSDSKVKFHTPYLRLSSSNAYWKRSSTDQSAVIGANLRFNYDVPADKLADKLKVTVDGKKTKFRVLNSGPSNSIRLEATNVDMVDESNVQFLVTSGLPVLNSNWTTKEEMTAKVSLTSPTEVTITGLDAEHDGLAGRIDVMTSQQVVTADLSKKIRIEPSLAFSVEENANGFTISSEDFDASQNYQLTIDKSLAGVFAGDLGRNYESPISFGKLEPSIKFTNTKSNYLNSKGNKNLGIKIINVPKISVKVYKIFDNNIMSFLQKGMSYGWKDIYNDEEDYWEYFSYRYYDTENFGKLVDEMQLNSKDLERVGKTQLLTLNFDDGLPQYDGLYVVRVEDVDRSFLSASTMLSFSDLGMIVKQAPNDIAVYVNSINTAKSVAGTEVSFISKTNQNIYTTVTNEEGIARFADIDFNTPNFEVAMITAKRGNDFNYLYFKDTRVNTGAFELGGKNTNAANYEAFIYGDRNIYRPGETINVNTIVRKLDWDVPADIPIKLKLLLPNGREHKTVRKTLNKQGACQASFSLPSNTVTGTYMVEAYTGNDILLNAEPISVEEFMPDRIKVDIGMSEKETTLGDSITMSGTAFNLFGPPATNRNYEAELTLKRKSFTAKEFPNYTFHMNKNKNFGKVRKDGQTDGQGEFDASFFLPTGYSNMGILNGNVFVTVFDESGRPVNRVTNFEVLTQDVFYGIGNFGRYNSTRTPIEIPVVAVNKEGKTQNVEANIEIIGYRWRTVLETTSRGRYRYRSQKEEITEADKTIKLTGSNTKFNFIAPRSGSYEVRISSPDAKTYVSRSFYAYRYGDTESTAFEVDQEGKIDIQFDKEKYEVGDVANVLLKTPFEGRLLVTLERDNIMKSFYYDTDKKSKQISLDVTEDFLPNVFVTATLIRPMSDMTIPLTVAHGFAPLVAENADRKIPIEIVAEEKSRAKTKQTIKVKTKPNTEFTLAVVDEGILQVKDYKTPEPYDYFYQKRALAVNTYDVYPYLYPEMVAANPLVGGGYNLGKRTNPIKNKRVKLVSFWSGVLQSDDSGEAEYAIDIPQFSGDLRIMAVAYKNDNFGSADVNMKVADPVVVSTGLPRFLSPRDTVTVPVTMTNTTEKASNATAKLSVTGPLSIVGNTEQSQNLAANSEGRVEFKVVAQASTGAGQINVAVDALNETFTEETDITVRPAASLQKLSDAGAIKGGNTETLDMASNFIPESIDGQLLISKSPMAEFADDLNYLLGYPHGCVEQTVSKAFPQVYFYELSKSIGSSIRTAAGANSDNPNYNVQEAIHKLEGMQRSDGSFSYWPGGEYVNWWGSVFATHFLWEAKKAGFEVHDKMMKRAFKFLRKKLKKKETFVYHYYDVSNQPMKAEIARKEITYSLYVLALANQPDVSTMNHYKANPDLLSVDGRYLLASAYQLAGDKAKFEKVLPKTVAFSRERSKPALGGSFYSPIRDRAIALNALLSCDPDHPDIGIISKHLAKDFRKKRYKNTQERVFTFLAFGKLAKKANNSKATAIVSADGKTIGKFEGKDLRLNYADFKASKVDLKVDGDGTLYYFWDMEGLTADGSYKEEDSFLKVRRTFFDRDGRIIGNNRFQQNDLIVVALELATTESESVENVVITDMLPAGFEVENPRISKLPDLGWTEKRASLPDHQDFRDDRVHLYTTATNKLKTFYYMVRAVSPGMYQLGSVSADAMYDGEYHSYHGGGSVMVRAK